MKAAKGSIGRSVDRPDPGIRFYLFSGPDEAQSRALAERLVTAAGASKSALSAGQIKSDPALLADEAGAMSLFGGKRAIWIEPANDDIADAVEALLSGPAPESIVIAIAGTMRKSSALLKLAEAHPCALAHTSYAPEGQNAERMVMDVGRTFGLQIAPPVAARVADACGNDQAIVAQELAKLALYLDSAPEGPKELDNDAIDAVGAETAESDFLRLADLALAGDMRRLADELDHLSAGGDEAIPAIRSLQRRLLMLAPMRARVEAGESISGVMASTGKALFWKDKALVEKLLSQWDARGFAVAAERIGKLERGLMRSDSAPPREALGEELIAIARAARRR